MTRVLPVELRVERLGQEVHDKNGERHLAVAAKEEHVVVASALEAGRDGSERAAKIALRDVITGPHLPNEHVAVQPPAQRVREASVFPRHFLELHSLESDLRVGRELHLRAPNITSHHKCYKD